MPLTIGFAVFVTAALILHNSARGQVQNAILLVASYALYAYLDLRFVLLLAFATAITYFLSRRIGTAPELSRRLLYLGLAFNVGVLVWFKLDEFFIPALVARLGLAGTNPTLQVLMPLGISFYSFRLISYLLDTANKRLDPAQVAWLDLAVYVAFFPQITSGPIERAPRFLPRLQATRRLNRDQLINSLTYIFIGFYYKIAIADPLVDTINRAFSNVPGLAPADALATIIFFSIQLYADFAGYSAIAIGISTLFGLPAMENFRQPYLSQSVIEFWTRWHISLSTWLRDYLFYPLSRSLIKRFGSRRALAVQVISYLVTMLVAGVWHGAAWTFVLWGVLFGVYMSFESLVARVQKVAEPGPAQRWINILINILITQAAVAVSWVFFRASSIHEGLQMIQKAILLNSLPGAGWWISLLTPLLMLLVIDLSQAWAKDNVVIWRVGLAWRVALCSFMLLLLFIFMGKASAPFVYFHF